MWVPVVAFHVERAPLSAVRGQAINAPGCEGGGVDQLTSVPWFLMTTVIFTALSTAGVVGDHVNDVTTKSSLPDGKGVIKVASEEGLRRNSS